MVFLVIVAFPANGLSSVLVNSATKNYTFVRGSLTALDDVTGGGPPPP